MLNKEYKYSEATVRFYDTVYDNLSYSGRNGELRDKLYLKEISKVKGAVLEAGFGTGKILIPALNSGADIYGIDHSELMFAKTFSKLDENSKHRISLGDIRNFNAGRQFSLIISPFRVFQHLLTIKDQLSALNCVYEHLEEGGLYIFDLFCPDVSRLQTPVNEKLEFENEYEPGKKLKRYYSVIPDYINQIQYVTFKYEWDEDSGIKTSEYEFAMRYFFRYEIENLIGRTKFKPEHIYGDFNRSELSSKSSDFVIFCRK